MFIRRLYSESERPLVLLLALSLTLLIIISGTAARAVQVAPLLAGLERDLGALRANLELVPHSSAGAGRSSAASEAGLADGGATYRREAITTILRSAHRRSTELHARYLELDHPAAISAVAAFRTGLHTLQHRLTRLQAAPDDAALGAARADADHVLSDLERALAALHRLDRSRAALASQPRRLLPA